MLGLDLAVGSGNPQNRSLSRVPPFFFFYNIFFIITFRCTKQCHSSTFIIYTPHTVTTPPPHPLRVHVFIHQRKRELGGLGPQKASGSSGLWPHYSQGPAGYRCGRTSGNWMTYILWPGPRHMAWLLAAREAGQ